MTMNGTLFSKASNASDHECHVIASVYLYNVCVHIAIDSDYVMCI